VTTIDAIIVLDLGINSYRKAFCRQWSYFHVEDHRIPDRVEKVSVSVHATVGCLAS